MNEAVENVIVSESDEHRVEGPLPPVAPTDFTVVIGAVLAGGTEREIREDGGRIRGQVMALGSAMLGTW